MNVLLSFAASAAGGFICGYCGEAIISDVRTWFANRKAQKKRRKARSMAAEIHGIRTEDCQ